MMLRRSPAWKAGPPTWSLCVDMTTSQSSGVIHPVTFIPFLWLSLPSSQTARYSSKRQANFKKNAVINSFLHLYANENVFINNLYSSHVPSSEKGFAVKVTCQLRHKRPQRASDEKDQEMAFQAGWIARTNSYHLNLL